MPSVKRAQKFKSVFEWLFDKTAPCDLPIEFKDADLEGPLTDLFQNWSAALLPCTAAEQNSILWMVIGYPLYVGEDIVGDSKRPISNRCNLIRSMEHVTAAIPDLHAPEEPMENGYFMWWDTVATACTEPETQQACFEVLSRLIENPDHRVQVAAVHGLGHLAHPDRPRRVGDYIAKQTDLGLDREWHKWLEECRDGRVM